MSKRVTVIVEGREYIVEVGDLSEQPIKATVNQKTYQVQVPPQSDHSPGPTSSPVASHPKSGKATPSVPATSASTITAPMPGDIVEVKVKVGDSVSPGDVVCVLEAMKMKNMIYAGASGVIASVDVIAGQSVGYGAKLVTFE